MPVANPDTEPSTWYKWLRDEVLRSLEPLVSVRHSQQLGKNSSVDTAEVFPGKVQFHWCAPNVV